MPCDVRLFICSVLVSLRAIYPVLFSRIFASWDEGLGQSTRMEEREGRNRTVPPCGYIMFCTLGTAGPGSALVYYITQGGIPLAGSLTILQLRW